MLRLKQQGLRKPFLSFEADTTIRFARVSAFAVEPIQRSHSQRAIGVTSSQRCFVSGLVTSPVFTSVGIAGSGQSLAASMDSLTVSPTFDFMAFCIVLSTCSQWPPRPSGPRAFKNSKSSIVPLTMTCPREGSLALALCGNLAIIQVLISESVVSKFMDGMYIYDTSRCLALSRLVWFVAGSGPVEKENHVGL